MKTTAAFAILSLTLSFVPSAHAVTFDWATVGNPGNASEASGGGGRYDPTVSVGGVSYVYNIGQHEVTNSQYVEFLNAVAKNDTFGVFDTRMGTSTSGGILRSGLSGNYSYAVKSPAIGRGPGGSDGNDYHYDNKPVVYASYFDAMRFVNWLHNGQLTGSQNANTTEDGAYTITDGISESRNPSASFFIPSESEWYKAAYHKNDGVTGNYFNYPTSSNSRPSAVLPSADTGNSGNSYNNFISGRPDYSYLTGSEAYPMTDVGAYSLSSSPYGTYDQGGNAKEWTEAIISTLYSTRRSNRGGSWYIQASAMEANYRDWPGQLPNTKANWLGFRVASAHYLLTTQEDLLITSASQSYTGNFGGRNRVMDPLDQVVPLNPFGEPLGYGSYIETEAGWEGSQDWFQTNIDGLDYSQRVQTGDKLLGQWSRIGQVGGNVSILGQGSIGDEEFRTRTLTTTSEGSFSVENTSEAIDLDIIFELDAKITATTTEKFTSIAVNLLPGIVGTTALTVKELVKKVAEYVVGEAIDLELELVSNNSAYEGSLDATLVLRQNGQTLGSLAVEIQEDAVGADLGFGGGVLDKSYGRRRSLTLSVDPTLPIEYSLAIETSASARGTATSHVGVTDYVLTFSDSLGQGTPLVIERHDPSGEIGVDRTLLWAAVNTPEFVLGSVEQVESIGSFEAGDAEQFVLMENAETSGVTMPVNLTEGDEVLQFRVGAMVSDLLNLSEIGIQLAYFDGTDFIDLAEYSFNSIFDFSIDSEVATTPFGADFVTIDVDIASLQRGDGFLFFAFGNTSEHSTEASLVLDYLSVITPVTAVPEPSSLVLFALCGLLVSTSRRCGVSLTV